MKVIYNELKDLEDLYFKKKKPCLLLVNKNLSFDSSFKGDFNLHENILVEMIVMNSFSLDYKF